VVFQVLVDRYDHHGNDNDGGRDEGSRRERFMGEEPTKEDRDDGIPPRSYFME
jgi:hypothetical protein